MAPYYHSLGREWSTELFRDTWPTTINFTLESTGAIVGFLRLSRLGSAVRIRDLQIVEGAKRRGIGSAAVEAAEHFAREHGADTIQLSVFESNPAIRLYERFGFRKVGESEGVISFEKRAVNN